METPSDYIPLFQNEGMKFQPGEKCVYSNGGFILLGIIIEDVTGMKYRDFIEQQILKPCKMCDTGYFALNKLPVRTALGYMNREDGSWQTNIFNLPIIGASDGGIYTTVNDIKKLWRAFAANKVLSKELVDQFTTIQTVIDQWGVSYGYGRD